MKSASILACALVLVPALSHGQSEILVEIDPPLTRTMVSDFQLFMQWLLEAPLTEVQEIKLRDYLLTSWNADNRQEISRVRNLLALRQEMEGMGLQNSAEARRIVRRNALMNWRQRSGENVAPWGLQIFDHATKPIAAGPPELTRQMSEAYAELAWHIYRETSRVASPTFEAETRARVVESVGTFHGTLTPIERSALQRIPTAWALVRRGWASLPDEQKAAVRTRWSLDIKTRKAGWPSSQAFLQMVLAGLEATLKPFGGVEAYGTGW